MKIMEKWIWFDMDGTIADLYSVEGWLDDLRNFNPRPYRLAKPMYNMNTLCAVCTRLKDIGYHIGIISWLSKVPEANFDKAVTDAKIQWLAENALGGICDEILVTPHGLCKADTCRKYGKGILIDDEEKNRLDWDLGDTINAKENILAALLGLL